MSKKVITVMRVAVHPIVAALWENRRQIQPGMPLREIGKIIGVKPKQIKYHLDTMVEMGAIVSTGGQYVFPGEPDGAPKPSDVLKERSCEE